jgi:hypothetical protein
MPNRNVWPRSATLGWAHGDLDPARVHPRCRLDALTADLAHEALAQQRQNGVRVVTAAAGIYLSTKDQRPG